MDTQRKFKYISFMRDSAKKQKCKDTFEGRALLLTPLHKLFNPKPQGQIADFKTG